MEQDQGDKDPEQVEEGAIALREQVLPRKVVMDSLIGDTALKVTLMPPALGSAVADYLEVEEGDVPLVVVEAEGGAGSRLYWCKNYNLYPKLKWV